MGLFAIAQCRDQVLTPSRSLALSLICDLADLAIMFGWMGDVGLLDELERKRLVGSELDPLVAELIQVFLITGLLLPCLSLLLEWHRVYAIAEVILDLTELWVLYFCSTVLRPKEKHPWVLLLNAGSSLLDALIVKIPEACREHHPTPLQEEEERKWLLVDGGLWHSVALSDQGTLVAFGSNMSGQLEVPALPDGDYWCTVAAGGCHCVALTATGQLHAWGQDDHGQVSCLPQQLHASVSWEAVAAGWAHSMALSTAGTLEVWGDNAYHQCEVPPLPQGCAWVCMAAGTFHSLALRDDDVIVSWGRESCQDLHEVPKLPASESCIALAAGWRHSLALFSGGSLLAWGDNTYGQCRVPQLPPGQGWTAIAAGHKHSLGLCSSGEVHCWGRDNKKQCSDRPCLSGEERWLAIGAGWHHSFGIHSWGISGWGDNDRGQVDVPEAWDTPAAPEERKERKETDRWVSVAGGTLHSVALSSSGVLEVFGNNEYGQLEAPPLSIGDSWWTVDAGWFHCLATTASGQLRAWGDDCSGQVSRAPQCPPPGASWQATSTGGFHSLALSTDGSLQAWGDNHVGQCEVPALPAGLKWLHIAAGMGHSLGLRDDGVIVSWGGSKEHFSQYLLEERTSQEFLDSQHWRVPQLMAGASPDCRPWHIPTPMGETCIALAAGGGHSLALFSAGTLLAWGFDNHRQCQVPELPDGQCWTAIAAGGGHSLGLTSLGEIYCWGHDGDKQCSGKPTLPQGEHWVSISCGWSHSLGISSSGRIHGWGWNDSGQAVAPEPPLWQSDDDLLWL